MKIFKNTLIIVALCTSNFMFAAFGTKPGSAASESTVVETQPSEKTTIATPAAQKAQTARQRATRGKAGGRRIIPAKPAIMQPTEQTYSTLLNQIKSGTVGVAVVDNNNRLTNEFIEFIKGNNNLSAEEKTALLQAGANLSIKWTGAGAKDNNILTALNSQIQNAVKPVLPIPQIKPEILPKPITPINRTMTTLQLRDALKKLITYKYDKLAPAFYDVNTLQEALSKFVDAQITETLATYIAKAINSDQVKAIFEEQLNSIFGGTITQKNYSTKEFVDMFWKEVGLDKKTQPLTIPTQLPSFEKPVSTIPEQKPSGLPAPISLPPALPTKGQMLQDIYKLMGKPETKALLDAAYINDLSEGIESRIQYLKDSEIIENTKAKFPNNPEETKEMLITAIMNVYGNLVFPSITTVDVINQLWETGEFTK